MNKKRKSSQLSLNSSSAISKKQRNQAATPSSSSSSIQGQYNLSQVETVLQQKFGFTNFRGPQREAINNVLNKKQDTFVLAPTGGGKSICYQLPALILPGLAIIVSPLIALMKDQVTHLQKLHLPAAFLGTGVKAVEKRRVYHEIDCAIKNKPYTLKILYTSPELLISADFKLLLRGLVKNHQVSFFAIDECHCKDLLLSTLKTAFT